MPRCRVLKDFTWIPSCFNGKAGQIIEPRAQLRQVWLKRGLIELIGEEAVEAKDTKAQAADVVETPKPKRGRPARKVAAI